MTNSHMWLVAIVLDTAGIDYDLFKYTVQTQVIFAYGAFGFILSTENNKMTY
jgi:hypothetical protein